MTDDGSGSANLTAVEWSTDNNHLLLRHDFSGGSEFVIFDRSNPADSVNLNNLLSINPTQVQFRGGKADQLFVFDKSAGTMQTADVGKATVDPPIIKNVLAFKAYDSSLLSYITDAGSPDGKVTAKIWNNGQTYTLRTMVSGGQYELEAAQYSGHWYYLATSSSDQQTDVYKDPIDNIQNPKVGKAVPIFALQVPGAVNDSFSGGQRFISVENGQNFGVYDLETQSIYRYTLAAPLTSPLVWMDGARLIGQSAGNIFVMDYDSTNQQSLLPTADPQGGLFSNDYNHLLTYNNLADGSFAVQNIDMRAGVDLPKTSQ